MILPCGDKLELTLVTRLFFKPVLNSFRDPVARNGRTSNCFDPSGGLLIGVDDCDLGPSGAFVSLPVAILSSPALDLIVKTASKNKLGM